MMRITKFTGLSLLFLLFSCSEAEQFEQTIQTDYEANENEAAAPIKHNKLALDSAISINDASGYKLAELTVSDGHLKINSQALRTKIVSSGKQKYLDQSGKVIAKIKRSDSQKFKLKTESGDLLWKIKRKSDSIKIANNEEMTPALKIKEKDIDRAKIISVDSAGIESELLQVRMQAGKTNMQLNNQTLTISAPTASTAAVLSLDSIPLAHRLIIVAELEH